MKYFSFIICAVIFFLGLNGCAGSRAKIASLGKTHKNKITFAQTLTNELAELARQPIRTTISGQQQLAQMGKDNSIIQTMYDAFGNKTENRVFYNDALLKMVVLKTSADGQQEALVYGQNGEVKVAPQNLLDKVLTSVAGEIAKTVQIFENRQENEMLAKLETPITPLTGEFPVLNLNQTTVEETAPVVETEQAKAETVATKSEIVEQAKVDAKPIETVDSALKLRAVVQSLKAVKSVRTNFPTDSLTAKGN